MASALRIFGKDKATFLREQASGLSTGGFYMGRSLGHLIISVLATFAFVLPLYAILQLHGSFVQLYVMLLLVYLNAASIGFLCSIMFSQSLGTVLSILVVLVFMLFGGSLYQHGVAFPDSILQIILWAPSWVSPLRWAWELFYLVVLEPYRPFLADPSLGYAYVLYGFQVVSTNQCWFTLVLLLYLFRVLPFLALVAKERY